MASHTAWPVVQPLPKIVVQLGLVLSFVLGNALLWNDRRVGRAATGAHKPMGVPVYK